MRSSTAFSAFVLAAATVLLVPSANAQNQTQRNQSPSTAAPSQSGPSAAISDQKIDAAAKAVKGVTAVKQDYEQKLAAAPDTEKGRIVNEANVAMQKAVTDQGLSVEEYTNILQVAQNDPTVHEKIIQRLR